MEFKHAPRWVVSPAEARAVQRELASRVSLQDRVERLDLVAGVDLAVGRFGETGRGALVVWRPEDGAVVEQVTVAAELAMPYIPGLLAFREGPVVEALLRKMRSVPDVIFLDGQGLAHPRACGIACQVGVLLDHPTVGVAKSRLYGEHEEPGPAPGDRAPLRAPDGREIGTVLRTSLRGKPLYVSPGHGVAVERAAELVWRCVRGHRLPEPTFLADRLSKTRDPRPA